MNALKRFVAFSAIGVSIVGIIMAVVSIIGIWKVYQPITESFTTLAFVAESGLEVVDGSLQVIDPLLSVLQNSMVTIQERGEELKSDIVQGNPIIDAISLMLGEDVQPKVDKALDTLETMRTAVQDVNMAVQTVNSLPFINLQHIARASQDVEDLFTDVSKGIDELNSGVDQLKEGLSQSVIQPIQDQAIVVENDLAEAQSEVQNLQEDVTATLAILQVVSPRIPLIITGISILLSVQLLWGAIAQIAMAYLAWMYLKFGRLDWHRVGIDLAENEQESRLSEA